MVDPGIYFGEGPNQVLLEGQWPSGIVEVSEPGARFDSLSQQP